MLVVNFFIWTDRVSGVFWGHEGLTMSGCVIERPSPPKRPSPMPSRPKPGSWNTPKTWVCSLIPQQRLLSLSLLHWKVVDCVFLHLSTERCRCEALCGSFHKRSKLTFASTGQTLHRLAQADSNSPWFSPSLLFLFPFFFSPKPKVKDFGIDTENMFEFWDVSSPSRLLRVHPRCAVEARGSSYK